MAEVRHQGHLAMVVGGLLRHVANKLSHLQPRKLNATEKGPAQPSRPGAAGA